MELILLKVLLAESSRQLFTALDGRAHFKQAIVVVPRTWTESKCRTQIKTPIGNAVYVGQDIRLDASNSSPQVHQSRGCGHSGDFVTVGQHFFTSNVTSTKSKLFVAEFAKYRYGIFADHGFNLDPIYPAFYRDEQNVVANGASDKMVRGRWRRRSDNSVDCDPAGPAAADCEFVVDTNEDNDDNRSTCSLDFVPTVASRFCTTDLALKPNSILAPTKQHGICGGMGSEEVILGHSDFINKAKSSLNLDKTRVIMAPPVLNVVRAVDEAQYVLVLESGSSMSDHDLWKWVTKATHKLIRFDLDTDAKLALITFSNDSALNFPLTKLKDNKQRRQLADSVPDMNRVRYSPNQRSVIRALDKAMNLRDENNQEINGLHVILITRGDNASLTLSDERRIEEYLQYRKVKISSILLPSINNRPLAFYDKAAVMSGGSSFVIDASTQNDVDTRLYDKLVLALQTIRAKESSSASDAWVRIHDQVALPGSVSSVSSGEFVVDESLGRDTLFGVLVNDVENIAIKDVTFSVNNDKQEVFGPYASFSSKYHGINLMTLNFPQDARAPPFDHPAYLGRTWSYSVRWYPGDASSQPNVIVVDSKPRLNKPILSARMWLSTEETVARAEAMRPVIIYVALMQGDKPVLHANVSVQVQVLGHGQQRTSVVEEGLELRDNGNGDPDVTGDDGVYSRYLVHYGLPGRYTFLATVTDNVGRSFVLDSSLNMPCCGSRVSTVGTRQLPTGSFTRTAMGPVLHLLSVPDVGLMPPARIGDLVAKLQVLNATLELSFTTPGKNYDQDGVASKYHIVFAKDPMLLIDKYKSKSRPLLKTIEVDEKNEVVGGRTTLRAEFRHFDQDLHVGVITEDEEGNVAAMSNLVIVAMPSPILDGNEEGSEKLGQPTTRPMSLMLAVVVVSVLVTLFLGMVIVLYVFCFLARKKSRKAKSNGVNTRPDSGESNSSFASDNAINRGVGNSHQQLVNNNNNISTISSVYYKDDVNLPNNNNGNVVTITPTYWSASQLLKEHEERKRRDSLARRRPEYKLENGSNELYMVSAALPEKTLLPPQILSMTDNIMDSSNSSSSSVQRHNNANKSSERSSFNNSNSLQGSLLSINSARPNSNASKTRNITQV